MMRFRTNSHGFTLVELVIAMALASMTMLVMSAGVIRLYNIYEAGNEIRNTQQAARSITEQITRQARDASFVVGITNSNVLNSRICIFGPVETNPASGTQLSGTVYWVENGSISGTTKLRSAHLVQGYAANTAPTNCNGTQSNQQDLTNPGQVTIRAFGGSVSPTYPGALPAMPDLLSFQLTIASSADLDDVQADNTCKGGQGSQYCSVTAINTSVLTRGGGQ
jgi:prepilin-type N-terminal cleavage/methylation domain-containing protein